MKIYVNATMDIDDKPCYEIQFETKNSLYWLDIPKWLYKKLAKRFPSWDDVLHDYYNKM